MDKTGSLQPFLESPATAGVFLDFDGTLSEIVPVPSDARPVEGAQAVLSSLAARFAVVAVVSGRSAYQLLRWLGPEVEVWGVHGAERTVDGEVVLSEEIRPYAETMAGVLAEAQRRVADLGIDGTLVEDKTAIVTLHYRRAADRIRAREEIRALAEDLALSHGLEVAEGKASLELRPPVSLSKQAVVRRRVEEANLEAGMFIGDDVVDLPAFEALEELAQGGLAALKVAVDSEEAPPELLSRADIVVEGPAGVLRFLKGLL